MAIDLPPIDFRLAGGVSSDVSHANTKPHACLIGSLALCDYMLFDLSHTDDVSDLENCAT